MGAGSDDGVDDLRKVADLTEEELADADFGTYPRAQYFDDLFRLTQSASPALRPRVAGAGFEPATFGL